MTKAIIFDCFGVLVAQSLQAFIQKHFPDQPENIAEMYRLDDLASRGELSWKQYETEVAALAGITNQQVWDELDNNPPNIELLEYIRDELKPKYKIGFLSNASDNWLEQLFTDEQQQLFDDVILSYQVGLAKPDAEIFRLAAQNLGMLPEQCIFVDDLARYCEGAEATGMRALQYSDFSLFKSELRALLSEQA